MSIRHGQPATPAKTFLRLSRKLPWVLGHVIQHETYHGGQAVLLSRLWRPQASRRRELTSDL